MTARLDGPREGDIPRLRVSLPREPTAPGIGRRSLSAIEPFADDTVLDDVRLLVSELVTNSLMHSGAGPTGRIDLTVEVRSDTVRVSVRDQGSGFDHRPRRRGPRGSGWGLFLLNELSDEWGIERFPDDGTAVWFEVGRRARTPGAGTG
jgi:anti-sigma regulatory factor (Ser/Thr protein kinase)